MAIQTIYESYTDDYMPYSRDTYKYIIDTIFAHVSFQNINILELGCGSGSFTRFLSERGNATITAVDISDNLLAIAKQKAKEVYFVQGYINHDFLTGLSLHKYDLILSFCFLHHLSKEARTDIAACLLKYMKKNAVFACFEPNRDNPSILFQYLYETKLNKKDYDSTEFPLSKYELDELFPSKQVDTYYMDVVYASPPPPPPPIFSTMKSLLKRNIKKIVMHTGYTIKPFTKMNYAYNNGIRFGETGNAVYKKCCVFFSELYQYMKNEERDERKRYDYFLSIYTM